MQFDIYFSSTTGSLSHSEAFVYSVKVTHLHLQMAFAVTDRQERLTSVAVHPVGAGCFITVALNN